MGGRAISAASASHAALLRAGTLYAFLRCVGVDHYEHSFRAGDDAVVKSNICHAIAPLHRAFAALYHYRRDVNNGRSAFLYDTTKGGGRREKRPKNGGGERAGRHCGDIACRLGTGVYRGRLPCTLA